MAAPSSCPEKTSLLPPCAESSPSGRANRAVSALPRAATEDAGAPPVDSLVQSGGARKYLTGSVLRAVYMGTPEFAAGILARLLSMKHLEIAAVYTQPDRPAGRGKLLRSSPVKNLALERGITVEQPADFTHTPRGDAAVDTLAGYAPDVLLVAAYGLILPQRVLDIPRLMPVNVHASLLPQYRGAAPIQRAIMCGELVTGVTIMRMEAGLDSGPVLLQRAVGIGIQDTSASMHAELAETGAELLCLALDRLLTGELYEIPQDHGRATYAPKLGKDEGLLDFSLGAGALHAFIRGVTPKPGASMILHRNGQDDIVVYLEPGIFPPSESMKSALADSARQVPSLQSERAHILGLVDGALLLSCGDGGYAFSFFRPAGRKRMDAVSFYNGYLAGTPGAYFSGRQN